MSRFYIVILTIAISLSICFVAFYFGCLINGYSINIVFTESGVTKNEFNSSFTVFNLMLSLSCLAISVNAFIVDKERKEKEEEHQKTIDYLKQELIRKEENIDLQ